MERLGLAPVGLALFLLAVLLPPLNTIAEPRKPLNSLQPTRFWTVDVSPPAPENFPRSASISPHSSVVLNQQLHPLAVIPANEINLATAYPSGGDWVLRLSWRENSAEFSSLDCLPNAARAAPKPVCGHWCRRI